MCRRGSRIFVERTGYEFPEGKGAEDRVGDKKEKTEATFTISIP